MHADQCFGRTQENPPGLRSEHSIHRSSARIRRRHSHGAASLPPSIRTYISTPINIPTTANWQAHYHGTANEIWQQTEGSITHFVAMLGTSGTFMGTTRRLKELNPTIRCISLQPDSSFHGIEGAKHMASAIVPKIYDPSLADENIEIATEDAYAMARRLARECGVPWESRPQLESSPALPSRRNSN